MDSKRFLIVNADDFGLSEGVNRGIIEAHERGIVTSASLMVLKPSAVSAAAYSREHLRLRRGPPPRSRRMGLRRRGLGPRVPGSSSR